MCVVLDSILHKRIDMFALYALTIIPVITGTYVRVTNYATSIWVIP